VLGLRLLLHRTPEKGRKDCTTAANILIKRDEISGFEGHMGGTGKKSKPPPKDGGKPGNPPPKPVEDDDEDGDIVTPKRDRHGDDDEPL
jgi:hypothetical protein